MSSPRDTPFTKTNSKSIYGKTPLESWVGTVVAYDSQKEQIEGGWGWRYKVRIMGDNTNTDQITDQQLSYAYVLLPTTAGSGGAHKMRSVRISQGDFVYGVRGGGAGAPTMILGVFPRTASQSSGDGNFKNLSGFGYTLNNNGILKGGAGGEFNEQKGPDTPGVSALDPKKQNLSNRPDPSPLVSTLGVDPKSKETVDNVETKIKPKTVSGNTEWKETPKGNPINTEQVKFILKNWDGKNYTSDYVESVIDQAGSQNLFSDSLVRTAFKKIESGGSGLDVLEILFTPKIEVNPA